MPPWSRTRSCISLLCIRPGTRPAAAAQESWSGQCAVSLILLLLCRCGLKDVVNYSVGKKSLAEQQYEDLLAVGNIVLQLACKSHTGSRGAQEQVNNPSVPLARFYICATTLLPVGSTKLFPEHPVLSFPADAQKTLNETPFWAAGIRRRALQRRAEGCSDLPPDQGCHHRRLGLGAGLPFDGRV